LGLRHRIYVENTKDIIEAMKRLPIEKPAQLSQKLEKLRKKFGGML